VLLEDLIRLELIKLKFPKLHDIIYEEYKEFLDLDKKDNFDSSESHWVLSKEGRERNAPTKLEIYIESKHHILNINTSDVKVAQKAVRDLFRADWSFRSSMHLAINNPFQFYKYFYLGVLKSAIPEKEFNHYRNKSKVDFLEQIAVWQTEDKTRHLVHNLNSVTEFKDKDDFEKILSASLKICQSDNYSLVSHRRLHDLMYDGERKSKSKKYYAGDESEYKTFISSLFLNAPSPFLAESEFIEYLIKYEMEIPLTYEELTQISLNYLRHYLSTKPKFNFIIYRLTLNIIKAERTPSGNNSYQIRTLANPEAKEIFKNYVKDSDVEGFLLTITSEAIRDDKKFHVSWETAHKLFDNFDGFEEFINSLEETNLVKEYKDFFDLHKASSFAPVEFDFKYLPIKARE
jgi:hypothetical protein